MKFCVFGAGAIGGYLAVELASAGHEVCAIARGAHLQAIRQQGLKVLAEGREIVRIAASDDPTDFGPQELGRLTRVPTTHGGRRARFGSGAGTKRGALHASRRSCTCACERPMMIVDVEDIAHDHGLHHSR